MPPDSNFSFSVRDYRPEDFTILHGIDRACFPDCMAYSRTELAFYLGHPASICRIADCGGTVLGFVVGRLESTSLAHVITLDVIAGARRQGVGTSLMAVLHGEFRARGVTQVGLEVAVSNEGAQRFYKRLGYERVGLLRNYYQARSDAYRMFLRL